jgi:ParB family chromosome partitioning protein
MSEDNKDSRTGDTDKRTNLGRGLAALFGEESEDYQTLDTARAGKSIAIEHLHPNKNQPRRNFDSDELTALADSIAASGILQPVLVRRHPDRPSEFEIVAGERRWRASQIAGLSEIPVVIRDISDSAAIAMALIENIQRENLNPLEEAIALRRLIDEFDMTHQGAAEAIGRSRAAVSNLLRLLDLAPEAKALVQSGRLEMGHARALLGLSGAAKQAEVARLVASKGLTVRETERLVKRLQNGTTGNKGTGQQDPDIRRLQDELGEKLGATVAIEHGAKGKGKLVVRYNSVDELEGILGHIK